jgi:hypothetical protein
MSLADIEARARARAGASDPRARAKRYADAENARRLANLKAEAFVVPLSEWLGHNNGPDWDIAELFLVYCWKKAVEKAWTPPTMEIGIRRARKAEALGISYKQYVLEILERGRYLNEDDVAKMKAH